MELYLIRHAQSTNNALEARDPHNYTNSRTADPPVTDLGWQQAQLLAQHLAAAPQAELVYNRDSSEGRMVRRAGYGVTKLFCSPMWRSLQTALPVGEALGLQPEVWVDIHEQGGIFLQREVGRVGYPGRTRAQIAAEFPAFIVPERITEAGWWNRDYEDTPTMHGRAIRIAHDLRQRATTNPDERLALISHGTFMDALLKALFNQLPRSDIFHVHFNTGITHLHFCSEHSSNCVTTIAAHTSRRNW